MNIGIALSLLNPEMKWIPDDVRIWFGTSSSHDEAKLFQFLLTQPILHPIGIATVSYAVVDNGLREIFQEVLKKYEGGKFSLGLGDKSRMAEKQFEPTFEGLFQTIQIFSEVKYLASLSPKTFRYAKENQIGIIANTGDPAMIEKIRDEFGVKSVIAYLPLDLPDFTSTQREQYEKWVGRMTMGKDRSRIETKLEGLKQRLADLRDAGAEETIISTSWTPKGKDQVKSLLDFPDNQVL